MYYNVNQTQHKNENLKKLLVKPTGECNRCRTPLLRSQLSVHGVMSLPLDGVGSRNGGDCACNVQYYCNNYNYTSQAWWRPYHQRQLQQTGSPTSEGKFKQSYFEPKTKKLWKAASCLNRLQDKLTNHQFSMFKSFESALSFFTGHQSLEYIFLRAISQAALHEKYQTRTHTHRHTDTHKHSTQKAQLYHKIRCMFQQ